jgi:single-strand DNA-binding protein
MNVNIALIVGRLTKDPELKATPSGQSVATFGVATSQTYLDKAGQKKEQTQFHNIVVWGKPAENCKQYLVKGQIVSITGRIQTREWEKDGQKHRITEVIAQQVQFGPKPTPKSTASAAPASSSAATEAQENVPIINVDSEQVNPDDLPF